MKNICNLELVGKNGNAFNLIALFRKRAKKVGWTQEEIDQKTKELEKGTYADLLKTLTEL